METTSHIAPPPQKKKKKKKNKKSIFLFVFLNALGYIQNKKGDTDTIATFGIIIIVLFNGDVELARVIVLF